MNSEIKEIISKARACILQASSPDTENTTVIPINNCMDFYMIFMRLIGTFRCLEPTSTCQSD